MKNVIKRPCRAALNGFLVAPLLLLGCEFIRVKEEGRERAGDMRAARVNDRYLYASDLEVATANSASKADSAARAKVYIDQWIKKQLFIDQALKQPEIGLEEIEKQVADYRNSLIAQQFRNLYVARSLVDSVSESQIQAYYNAHQAAFPLRHYIIRGAYVKTPRRADGEDQLKRLILARDDKSREELKSYCISFAASYYLSELGWVDLGQLTFDTPFASMDNSPSFFQNNPYHEARDDDFFFALKIDDYRSPGDTSPLEFVKEEIKNIIVRRRKADLMQRQEKEIYEDAVEHKAFEVYTR